ncbi:hypothetical protein [Falsiroseomonas oryzae]|uniref:hypothetical protein n=1 Tax=Falsiroseomonas oryzae TaxID=2766473 RepID=UPI0022EACCD2|nr:hypothetical protein [Roseomonas sp. MO-31]
MRDARYRLDAPHLTRADAYRLFETYANLSRELVQRPVTLVENTAWQLLKGAAKGALGPWSATAAMEVAARELRDLAVGLAAVPAAAATSAALKLSAPDRDYFGDIASPLDDHRPKRRGHSVKVDFAEAVELRNRLATAAGFERDDPAIALPPMIYGAPFILPARVIDSSQGWASWFISYAQAELLLAYAQHTSRHVLPGAAGTFRPFATGSNRAMVTLWGIDHRTTDFGTYRELALSLTVVPFGWPPVYRYEYDVQRDPAVPPDDPGQMFLRLIVTDHFSIAPAWQAWGFAKDYWGPPSRDSKPQPLRDIVAEYGPEETVFRVASSAAPKGTRPLSVAFPRFGDGQSAEMPTTIYSVAPGDAPGGRPVRSAMTTGGKGQGIQFGGPVRVELPEKPGRETGCLCSGGMDCLCALLAELGIDKRPPAVNGWTEHLNFTLGRPLEMKASGTGA